MNLGMIGLGKMGANMVRRLRRAGIGVTGFDRQADVAAALARECGMSAAKSVEDLVARCQPPRTLWSMLPAGAVTEAQISALEKLLGSGDTLIDGANSHFKDSMDRARRLAPAGIDYLDVGVSGGVWGLTEGYALMVGGPPGAVERLRPVGQRALREDGPQRHRVRHDAGLRGRFRADEGA